MKITEVIKVIEEFAPLTLQESYDNAGLIVGDKNKEVSGALLCLDCTEEIVDEAVNNNCNLIIAHHPIVFSGLKKITGKNYIERTIIKAIQNNVAIYAAHTNLDNVYLGVNKKIGEKLGVSNPNILLPKQNYLSKLVVFVPKNNAEAVRQAMFNAGAGKIGNYDECSYNLEGIGTFRAGDNTNPYVGEIGKRHSEQEIRIEVILPNYLLNKVIHEMVQVHPYEEVAYDVYPLSNSWAQAGSGMYGEIASPIKVKDFLDKIKNVFRVPVVRHTSKDLNKTIQKIAWCGGSGSFLLPQAKSVGADIFITGDFKYHQFFDAENDIIIADIGHYESEQFTIELFYELLTKNFSNFAIRLTEKNTNPINYY
jgi:dinuclear metal center YbgI/SA1388 family protein